MDKIEFLATLAGKLSEYPMPPEEVEISVSVIKAYLDRVSDSEFSSEPATVEDIEEIARGEYEKYLREVKNREAEEANVPAEPETAETEADAINYEEAAKPEESADYAISEPTADEIIEAVMNGGDIPESDGYEPPAPEDIIEQLETEEPKVTPEIITSDEDFFEMLAKEAEGERSEQARVEELELKALAMANKEEPDVVAQVLQQDENLAEMVASSDIAEEFDPIEGAYDPTERPDIAYEESDLTRVFTTDETDSESDTELMVDKDGLKKVGDEPTKKSVKQKKKREKVKGSPLFWVLFILTLPITMPIMAVICVLFGVMYVGVTALIVAFSGIMVATVAAGTALALVGIIYGITKCFKMLPVGLFEIGIGIAIGGVTMLLSVLIYNLAIRCMPKLYKQVTRFGGFVFGKIGDLYTNIKKECGKKK